MSAKSLRFASEIVKVDIVSNFNLEIYNQGVVEVI